jgi:hypothetical protein
LVNISAVERAELRDLCEGQSVSFDLERDSRSGKLSAANLRADSCAGITLFPPFRPPSWRENTADVPRRRQPSAIDQRVDVRLGGFPADPLSFRRMDLWLFVTDTKPPSCSVVRTRSILPDDAPCANSLASSSSSKKYAYPTTVLNSVKSR